MNIKERIKELIPTLPKKDRPIAINLLEKGDYQTLVELVDSDIKIAKSKLDKSKDLNEDQIAESGLIISDMQALKIVIQSHIYEEEEFFNSLDTSSRLMENGYFEDETFDM